MASAGEKAFMKSRKAGASRLQASAAKKRAGMAAGPKKRPSKMDRATKRFKGVMKKLNPFD